METNRLKQFKVIVETENLRKAADLLSISHSGLSKSMRVLEEEVGFSLFNQSGRGIVVTDKGMRLYEKSFKFLEELDHLLSNEVDPLSETLRIGSFEVFTTYFMGELLKEDFQDNIIKISELVPGQMEEALLSHKIDIGITYEPIPIKKIEFLKVTSLKMAAFTIKNAFKNTPIEEIPFAAPITPLEGAPSGVKGLDGWPEEKFPRTIKYRVEMMETAIELTRKGLSAIFLPEFVADLHNKTISKEYRLIKRDLPKKMPQIKRDIYIVKREGSEESAHMKKIAKHLRKICST